MVPDPPSRAGAALAYAISALTTLLWFACVLPAGPIVAGHAFDAATPMYREAWLLVPALLLLIIMPVGIVLSQSRVGRLAVLAGTDTFVAGYAGLVLVGRGNIRGDVSALLVAMMLFLAFLSLAEVVRLLRAGDEGAGGPLLKGVRFAIALLALLMPAGVLVLDGRELASLLAPFVVVAVGSGGSTLARAPLGLRFTASLVHALLATHLVVTLRYTLFDAEPAFTRITIAGWVTLGLAILILLLALVQALRLYRRYRRLRVEAAALGPASPAPAA